MHVLTIFASSDNSSGGGIAQLGIFLLIPVAMYFLLIRPQRKRQREQIALQAAIGVGDEVMTTSGMYGFITGFDGDVVWLEVDDNIQVRMSRAAIQRKVDTSATETIDTTATASTAPGSSDIDALIVSDDVSDDDKKKK